MNEELEHWKLIINTVFAAEDNLKSEWQRWLLAAKTADEETRQKICDGYVTAIANEILSKGKK